MDDDLKTGLPDDESVDTGSLSDRGRAVRRPCTLDTLWYSAADVNHQQGPDPQPQANTWGNIGEMLHMMSINIT